MKNLIQDQILNAVSKALDCQFEGYSWERMIDDIEVLSPKEKQWAKDNLGYMVYKMSR